jgi:NAD(P)-dependent dehydrogenase (short-subunit alcohol dehydrogenase family)
MKTLLVVGASGDIGQGIVAAALDNGWNVVAAGRNQEKFAGLIDRHAHAALEVVLGDISSEAGADALWTQSIGKFKEIDAVAVAVNAPNQLLPLAEWSAEGLSKLLASNLLTHFIAAKIFLPRLPESGMLIGIGGGTADFIIPKMAYLSLSQAAQRMMYRGFARERKGGAEIRELMVISMVNGESKRARAEPEWVTDVEVGQHVCAILAKPSAFPGPVLQLKSREQVGQAEASST